MNNVVDLDWIALVAGTLKCSGPDHGGQTDWCEHIKIVLQGGHDANFITPGATINVPVMPTAFIWAVVNIGTEMYGDSALMKMHYTPDIGRDVNIPLGFWNPGEGMASIRTVIIDYLRSRIDPYEKMSKPGPIITKCPNGSHGMREMRMLAENWEVSEKWTCLWNIVMEKACTPCMGLLLNDDDNFGLDKMAIKNRPDWAK